MTAEKRLFEGVNVLDFTWAGVGPRTTRFLAEYGACVVKVESSHRPDPLRTLPPFKDDISGIDRSYVFTRHSSNKLSFGINLNHPKAMQVMKRLVAWADILAESFTPGSLKTWGLHYEEAKKIKPDIIMMSTCMQGQTGPSSVHPGYGIPLTSLSGFTHITGWPDRPPSGTYGPYTDFVAPAFNVVAMLAALDYKRRTGKGQHLDLSQNECGLHFLSPMILDYEVNGREFTRRGNRSDRAAPHGVYPCKGDDRWCAIAICSDEEWHSFSKVIGNPGWTKEPAFASLEERMKNIDKLDKQVGDWTLRYSPEEVMERMQAAGVAAGVVKNGEDLNNDPQLEHCDAFPIVNHPEVGPCAPQRVSIKLSKTSPCAPTPPPCLGEHTEYVCKEFLGIPEEEFVELLLDHVFE